MRLEESCARIVERYASKTAVCCGEVQLSYEQLDDASNRFALGLHALGVKFGDRVGLCMERSVSLIVAILGTYKAGAAYVALDPIYPDDRLRYMAVDSGVKRVVVDDSTEHRLEGGHLHIEQCLREGDHRKALRAPPSHADAPAYVLYTSGSSGTPKGTLVSHAQVGSLLGASRRLFDFDERDVWSQTHSYAFDFSVWEIWGALLNGGTLVIAPAHTVRDPRALVQALQDAGVTVLNQTPGAFRVLAEHILQKQIALPSLRYVIFGGEALDTATVRRWFQCSGDARAQLVNMYGITETTVHVTHCALSEEVLSGGVGTPIGSALPNLSVHVLDEELSPVLPGGTGEIYVGGEGVSWGYINQPALTAKRFVPNPFAQRAGERLYRSGDLAALTQDGSLRYLGRIDQQVKIRGHRVELGEIEAALMRHPDVAQAAVVLKSTEATPTLVAYLVARERHQLAAQSIRDHLRATLPEYMVPAKLLPIEHIPLNQNGKVDRALLSCAPEPPALESGTFEAPGSTAESMLAEIWKEVLAIDRVSRTSNFFELGGDSIRSIQVKGIAEERGWSLEVRDLFELRTLAEIAARMHPVTKSAAGHADNQAAVAISESATEVERYGLTLMQAGMLYFSARTPGSPMYHDVYCVDCEGELDLSSLDAALGACIARHPVLRTAFDVESGTEPQQLVYPRVSASVQELDWRDLASAAQSQRFEEWLREEQRRDFDWKTPPLLRAFVHRFSDRAWRVALSFHHALLDGWSLRTLVSELLADYGAKLGGRASRARAPRARFKDLVDIERRILADEAETRFWLDYLEDIPSLRLSAARSRRALNQCADEADQISTSIELDESCEQRLKRLAVECAVPVSTVLLAGHCKALQLFLGTKDIVTGVLTHVRPSGADGDKVVGLFVNMLPVRVRVAADTWRDLIRAVREQELRCWAHRFRPYADICRLTGRGDFLPAVFNFTKFHVMQRSPAPEVRLLAESIHERSSFPITLQTAERVWNGRLCLLMQHRPVAVEAWRARHLVAIYEAVYRHMATQPGGLCSSIDVRQVLAQGKGTPGEYSQPLLSGV